MGKMFFLVSKYLNNNSSYDFTVVNKNSVDNQYWKLANIGLSSDAISLRGQIENSRKYNSGMIQADGALVFMDNNIFPIKEVGDSFALIKNAGHDTKIDVNGTGYVTSHEYGVALVTNLQPFYENIVSIDPKDIPVNFRVPYTQKKVITNYNQATIIDFNVEETRTIVLITKDKYNSPLSAGLPVKYFDNSGTENFTFLGNECVYMSMI